MLGDLTRDFEGDLTPGEFELRVIALLGRLNLA